MTKKLILLCLFFSALSFASAQSEIPWWFRLEQGKQLFRSGAYGDALIAFEDARQGRIQDFARMEDDMILLLSHPDVRLIGDALDIIEIYIAALHETRAARALSELYHRVPRDSLGGSVNRALEELDRLKGYPEAEFWLGETYWVEGELSLALRQYEKAYRDRSLLEIPEFDVEILYRMAELHRVRQEYQEMEMRLREIISGTGPTQEGRDMFWADNSMIQIRAAMLRLMENEGIDRFLVIYRYENHLTERAHRLLGSFFYTQGRYTSAVEHLLFSFLIQNTLLINQALLAEFDFTYTSLSELFIFINSRPDLMALLDQMEYYRVLSYLASSLQATGRTRPAAELWAFLASRADAGVWGDRARRNSLPIVDVPIELP
ncbi:MAG: hypothetical protein FWH12_04800 [Treponema sp.]|nr:hypothetical protein [Treponema sp.]